MRKKLLLSTLLASSAFATSSALAVVPNISYNTSNQYVINGQTFDNYGLAKQYLGQQVASGATSPQEVLTGIDNISGDSWGRVIGHSIRNDAAAADFVAFFKDYRPGNAISIEKYQRFTAAIRFLEDAAGFNFQEELNHQSNDQWEKFILMQLYSSADEIIEIAENLKATQQSSFEVDDESGIESIKNTIAFRQLLAGKSINSYSLDEQIKEFVDASNEDLKNAKNSNDLPAPFKTDNYTTHAVMASGDAVFATIDNRMSLLNSPFAAGVASGDGFNKFGVWGKGTMSRGEQKAFSFEPGYKFDQTGVTIGADIGEDFVLGAAYSFFSNNVKSKKINDTKGKNTTHIGTVYGSANIGSLYVNGQAFGGISDINKDRNTGDVANHVAKGKTTAVTYGGKVEIGYQLIMQDANIAITPSLAVAHNQVKVNGYKEKGDGLNRRVSKRDGSRTDAIAGLSLGYRVDTGGMVLIPEAHAFASQALNTKNSATKIYLVDGLDPVIVPGQKLNKTSYKFGGSLNLYTQGSVEASVGYDYGMAKKFESHTGNVKLRVNF